MFQTPDPDTHPELYEGVQTKRLLAWIADSLFVFLLTLLVVPFTAFTGLLFFPFLFLVTGFAYRVVTLANGSATFGMRFFALELRDAQDRKFDLSLAFFHTLGYTLSISTMLVQVASIVLMLTSARNQGLSDMVLGTSMLNKRRVR